MLCPFSAQLLLLSRISMLRITFEHTFMKTWQSSTGLSIQLRITPIISTFSDSKLYGSDFKLSE